MMASVKLTKLSAAVLAVLLMISLFAVPVFAESDSAAEATEAVADTSGAAEDTTAEAADETTASPVETQAPAGTAEDNKKEINWDLWISLGIIGLLVIVFFAFFAFSVKFRERVKKFFRDYKSELKKVVWSPWNDVKRNTVVVLVIALGSALLIGVLDFVFSKGIIALGTLIGK